MAQFPSCHPRHESNNSKQIESIGMISRRIAIDPPAHRSRGRDVHIERLDVATDGEQTEAVDEASSNNMNSDSCSTGSAGTEQFDPTQLDNKLLSNTLNTHGYLTRNAVVGGDAVDSPRQENDASSNTSDTDSCSTGSAASDDDDRTQHKNESSSSNWNSDSNSSGGEGTGDIVDPTLEENATTSINSSSDSLSAGDTGTGNIVDPTLQQNEESKKSFFDSCCIGNQLTNDTVDPTGQENVSALNYSDSESFSSENEVTDHLVDQSHQENEASSQPSNPITFCNGNQALAPTRQENESSLNNSNSNLRRVRNEVTDDTVAPTKQGAYWVTRTRPDGRVTHNVTIPEGFIPGIAFRVLIGNRIVSVLYDEPIEVGEEVEIELDNECENHYTALKAKPLTACPAAEEAITKGFSRKLGDAVEPMTAEVRRINAKAIESGCSVRSYVISVPENTSPGEKFVVTVGGKTCRILCPLNVAPGDSVCIHLYSCEEISPVMQTFAVRIPLCVTPGRFFAFRVGEDSEHQVVIQCPRSAAPGRTIQVKCPTTKFVKRIRLSYPSHSRSGWVRTVRESDLRFQWMRFQQEPSTGDNDASSSILALTRFDFMKSALVRKLIFLEGNSPCIRTGLLTFVPADQAAVDSKLVVNGKTFIQYADIAQQQKLPLSEKRKWFLNVCKKLAEATVNDFTGPGSQTDDYIKILVRRQFLLKDSIRAVFSLGESELRKRWNISFVGEPVIDAGGPTKEWIQCVTEQLLSPQFGLFASSTNNQAAMDIKPCCEGKFSGNHLVYYRFAGRMLGRALFDGKEIKGHLVRTLYKHILAWPMTYEDLEAQDDMYFQSLKRLMRMDDFELSYTFLNFTVAHDCGGKMREIELVENGESKMVNSENLPEYLEAIFRYRLIDRILPHLTEFLLGFYDVVPEPLLAVFDASELELLLCGLPSIDVDDWKEHTVYGGCFAERGNRHPVVCWFWKVVTEFDDEMRVRLLQFATGSSSVPAGGFALLSGGNDGISKPFTLEGVDVRACFYPKAHTCFNRIDLPNYDSLDELRERLIVAITTSCVGFYAEETML